MNPFLFLQTPSVTSLFEGKLYICMGFETIQFIHIANNTVIIIMKHIIPYLLVLFCLIPGCRCQNQEKKTAPPVPGTTEQQQNSQTVFHVRYEKPVNGFTVTAEIEPYEGEDWGPTTLTFSKGDVSFSVFVDAFTKEGFSLKGYDASKEIVLQYVPKPKDVILYDKEPFCFSDTDYDGVDEILVLEFCGGVHGVNSYLIFEKDGAQRKDGPFEEFDEHVEFDAKNKTITRYYYEDAESERTNLVYKYQKDGTFRLE